MDSDKRKNSDVNAARQTGNEEHYATVACFLKEKGTERVFGLTNRHVLVRADSSVYVRQLNGNLVKIGDCFSLDQSNDEDFGLFEIDKDIKDSVTSTLQDIKGLHKPYNIEIYSKRLDCLHTRTVFKYRHNTKSDSDVEIEIRTPDTESSGTVLTKEDHQAIFSTHEHLFLVQGTHKDFSSPGESGTAVAILDKCKVQLVGIIIGAQIHEKYDVCFFMPHIIKQLERCHGMQFELLKTPPNSNVGAKGEIYSSFFPYIYSGSTIFIFEKITFQKSPEKISPLSIDLYARGMAFMCRRYIEKSFSLNATVIRDVEKNLTRLVNERLSLNNCSIFQNETPSYVAMENGLGACEDLYLGNVKSAEKKLKTAILATRYEHSEDCRRFAKLLTYITWYKLYVNTPESLKEMKTLLKEGLEYYDDYSSLESFPCEVGAYLHYDYSRYYLQKIDNMMSDPTLNVPLICHYHKKAIDCAEKSVEIAVKAHDVKRSGGSHTRLILMKSEFAYTLAGCGHNFNTFRINVSDDLCKRAASILSDIAKEADQAPLVQNTTYLLAKCDLLSRRGEFAKALRLAEKCKSLSSEKDYKMNTERAEIRCSALQNLLNSRS